MFGRTPRLTIDAFLGLQDRDKKPKNHQNYVEQLKKEWLWLTQKQENRLPKKVRNTKSIMTKIMSRCLELGDRVTVRKVGIQGKHKLADLREAYSYIIRSPLIPDMPLLS